MQASDFNPTFAYSQNGSVFYNGKGYTSLQNGNTGNTPDKAPLFWKLSDANPQGVAGSYPAGDPRNIGGPHNNPNYDARLDPQSQSYDAAVRDRAGLGGVADRAGADYRSAASVAEFHAMNHTHDGSPYPGRHGERVGQGQGPYNGERVGQGQGPYNRHNPDGYRSEEHTSELQSLRHLVCRLLL